MQFLFLTGYSSSGKSTVSRHLIERHGFGHFSFRNALKAVAQQKNTGLVDYLDNTDIKQVKQDAIDETLRQLARLTDARLIIDGLYYMKYFEAIRDAFPQRRCAILAVHTDQPLREGRIRQREAATETSPLQDIAWLDGHKLRWGLEGVLASADITITNNGDISNLLTDVDMAVTDLLAR
jgi:dephospho-CoA kinase